MDSKCIIKKLTEKNFSTVLDDIQLFMSSGDGKRDCSEICNVLRVLFQAVKPTAELEVEDSQRLIFDLIPCFNLCIDYAQNSYSCSDLVEHQFFVILYHIIRVFLKFELYHPAVSTGSILKNLLADAENNFEERMTYIKNMTVIFWNEALETERNPKLANPNTAFMLRAASIDFLTLDKSNLDAICEKVNLNLHKYCQSSNNINTKEIENFLKRIWSNFENFDSSYDHKAYLYKILNTWIEILLKYLKDFSFMQLFLNWFQDLINISNKKKDQKVLNICVGISKVCIQFFVLQENDLKIKTCLQYLEFCKTVKLLNDAEAEILAQTCSIISFHLTKFFRSARVTEDNELLKFLMSGMNICVLLVQLYIEISSKDEIQKHFAVSPTVKLYVYHSVMNLFVALLKKEQDDNNKKRLIKESRDFVELSCSNLPSEIENSDLVKSIISYGTFLGHFGIHLYNCSLYPESIYFLEVNDSFHSLCSSTPEYNFEEIQKNLWRTNDVLVHAYKLSGCHEKALHAIVKLLIIYKNKTKDCFDLWRRVKRDAIRNRKDDLVPKTVSDLLLQINLTVSVEQEVTFLTEEFKACRSERCNFEEEIIAVAEKLLSLPCSKSTRAYLLSEIITLPANVCEMISSILKRSPMEMSLEAISLYNSHLAENSTDHVAKLHLSLLYFWLYNENMKKIHDVAAKEAENIFKLPTPKPKTGVQTDAGEENDTCDIQPTHPLVCLSIEIETLKNLELAVQLWEEVSDNWKDLVDIVKDKCVLDIIQTTAEIFASAAHDVKELKLWFLLQKVSAVSESKTHKLAACISLINLLIRLGYLNMASYYIKLAEESIKCINSSEFETAEMKLLLAKSNYFLYSGKFDEGLKIIEDVLKSPVLQKKYKSIKMLNVEALLLLSEYMGLPTKAFSNADSFSCLKSNFRLSTLMESVSLCKAVLKCLTEKQGSNRNFEWLCFKPLLLRNLLKSYLVLGEVYFQAGEPRFARAYLQDALTVAESHILSYWSSKILLLLGHIDLICDNVKDCQVKASGLQYILGKGKQSYHEILAKLQAKYASPNLEDPISPDSPDGLLMYNVPDVSVSRHIKQAFIDKIDVMSSPVSKRLAKNKTGKAVEHSYIDEKFSINLLRLECSLLSSLMSRTEADTKNSEEAFQELLDQYNELKNPNYFRSILASVKLVEHVKDPHFRIQTKPETLLCTSIMMQIVQLYCLKNNSLKARETINSAYTFLKKASHYPSYSFPNTYVLLRYHDIRISLCDFFKIPPNSSISYFLCPSIKSNAPLKKVLSEKANIENTPSTPVSKAVPKVIITRHQTKSSKCRAPLKKNLLNTNFKKDIEMAGGDVVQRCSPFVIFDSTSDEEHFESPYDSLSRASKTRSGSERNLKKSDKGVGYQFFKSKNSTLEVKSASDVWKLELPETPKLGKENRKLRCAKTLDKPSLNVTKKTRSANSSVRSTKNSKSKKSNNDDSTTFAGFRELIETSKESNSSFASSLLSERKLSIEQARSSPFGKVHRKKGESKYSDKSSVNPEPLGDTFSDSVFFSPSKAAPTHLIPNLIDDLCKDLSSLVLSKNNRCPPITAENLEDVIEELSGLRLLIENIMPYPLYSDVCRLLAILMLIKPNAPQNDLKLWCSFLLSEAFSVSLRTVHIANVIYFREPEFEKEKNVILKIFKERASNSTLQMQSFLQSLPEHWTVIQVSAFHTEEYLGTSNKIPCPTKLVMCQYQKNQTPLVIGTDCSSDERFSSSFLTEFDAILQESNLTMTNKDSKLWWNTRNSLDARMKELTKCMENMWLGCWKGIFLGAPQNEARIEQIQSTVDAICNALPCENKRLLQILIDSAQYLSKVQVSSAVSYLWDCSPEEENYKKLCQSIRHISIALPETQRHHVILILDQSVQALPWECIPILNGVPVSRMPSLSLLHTKLMMDNSESLLTSGIDASKTYYVLNPAGDLIQSQEYFQKRFERQSQWKGISGAVPNALEYASGFKDNDLLIYCGHGSGRQYFENVSVDKLRLQSTSIIMGCSSGRLRRLGRVLEAYGIVLKLLLSGCPSITANLWDVTDRDIDRFTDRLLQYFVPNYEEVQNSQHNVAKAASIARGACRLRYLVGAAPVVYGFPIFAKNQ